MGSDEVPIHPKELMQRLNLTEMTVRSHLKILEQRGYIHRKLNERGHHVYIVNHLIHCKE